jgi:hypothetical protein
MIEVHREARFSFCEQKEAKKLFILWSVQTLHPINATRRIKVFASFFQKEAFTCLLAPVPTRRARVDNDASMPH